MFISYISYHYSLHFHYLVFLNLFMSIHIIYSDFILVPVVVFGFVHLTFGLYYDGAGLLFFFPSDVFLLIVIILPCGLVSFMLGSWVPGPGFLFDSNMSLIFVLPSILIFGAFGLVAPRFALYSPGPGAFSIC